MVLISCFEKARCYRQKQRAWYQVVLLAAPVTGTGVQVAFGMQAAWM